jgi:hypothetical protein
VSHQKAVLCNVGWQMTDAAVPNKEADLNSRNGVPIDD